MFVPTLNLKLLIQPATCRWLKLPFFSSPGFDREKIGSQ